MLLISRAIAEAVAAHDYLLDQVCPYPHIDCAA